MLLGGAALTRTYVERDLREVYEGRLFYGKDAFEGLHTMDTLMEGKRSGTLDPDFGRALGGRNLPAAQVASSSRRRRSRSRRAPTSPPTCPIFTPPFLGARVAKGISLDEIAGVHQRDRAVPQPVAVPAREAARPTTSSRSASARRCAPSSTSAKAEGWLVPAVAWGYFPVNADGNDLVVWTDDDRRTERLRFTSRASRRTASSASPTSSAASSPATPTTPASTS